MTIWTAARSTQVFDYKGSPAYWTFYLAGYFPIWIALYPLIKTKKPFASVEWQRSEGKSVRTVQLCGLLLLIASALQFMIGTSFILVLAKGGENSLSIGIISMLSALPIAVHGYVLRKGPVESSFSSSSVC